MALHGKEKIWYVFDRLIDAQEIATGNVVGLHPADDLNLHFSHPDFIDVMKKLEQEKAAKFISLPTDQTYLKYQIKILPGFDAYHKKLWADPQYREYNGDKYPPKGVEVRKGYFYSDDEIVDLTLTKKENENRHLTAGKVAEIYNLPKDQREKIFKDVLTSEQVQEAISLEFASAKFLDQLPKLDDINVGLTSDPNYEAEMVGLLRQMVEQKDGKTSLPKSDTVAYNVTYSTSRDIILNGLMVLSRPTFNGENDLVFSHLFKNPGKSFTKKELEEAISQKIAKDFHKVVENLGFKGDLAKIFFSVSKNDIKFRNPVLNDDLVQMGVTLVRLNKTKAT